MIDLRNAVLLKQDGENVPVMLCLALRQEALVVLLKVIVRAEIRGGTTVIAVMLCGA